MDSYRNCLTLLLLTRKMQIMEWYLKVMSQYADFEGRARRKEYWMFVLYNLVFSFVATIVDVVLGFSMGNFGLLASLYALVILIPSIAVCVRRLHDIGKSGWMMLIILIPIVGGIWLLILFIQEGTPGQNEYGMNPKEL